MPMFQMANNNNVFWKYFILSIYKIISLLFAVIALSIFLHSLSISPGKQLALLISYIVLCVILVYGFWKMRKWVVPLVGGTAFFLIINSAARIFQGTQKINSALLAVLPIGAVFLFSYISRSRLEGEYKNMRVIRVFAVFLILSQILLLLIF